MDKYDVTMMDTAKIWAKRSYCKRRKVGAVLAKDGRILATGYNGTISGKKNECEDEYYRCTNCGHKETFINDLISWVVIKDWDYNTGTPVVKVQSKCNYCNHMSTGKFNMSIGVDTPSMFIPNKENVVIEDFIDQIYVEKVYVTNDFTVHAEQNVISFCAKNGIPTDGTTLYVTVSPCKQCSKLIAQSGIKRVVYDEPYSDTSGIDFLKETGVEVERLAR